MRGGKEGVRRKERGKRGSRLSIICCLCSKGKKNKNELQILPKSNSENGENGENGVIQCFTAIAKSLVFHPKLMSINFVTNLMVLYVPGFSPVFSLK